ncbi:HVO_0476 family zinc finger protein [Methanohalophilus sp.]|uniref:HVO_0476 family zinc finger protein n=1 Tax=Methanohalophilus sp. TaxID=1966352 RepID=UPI002612EFC5|nr:HVO_0476 family zinc finger protein [Methanohalophilus sp.]
MSQEIEVKCPACSPNEPTWHKIIKQGQNPLAKCSNCGDIHPFEEKKPKMKLLRAIISREDESFTFHVPFEEDDMRFVGEEIMLEDEKSGEVCPAIITSIEAMGKRVEEAMVSSIDTLWARAIDQVIVKVAIQRGGRTVSQTLSVPGDQEFEIGLDVRVGGENFRITHIKIRDGQFLYSRGKKVEAKYIKRIFARPANKKWGDGRTAWSMKRSARD